MFLHDFFQSVAEWGLTAGIYARLLSKSIAELSSIVSLTGARPWDGSQVGPFIILYSLRLCSMFVPTFPIDRTNFESKVWLGWCPYPFTGCCGHFKLCIFTALSLS
jgi:hypothetical protein